MYHVSIPAKFPLVGSTFYLSYLSSLNLETNILFKTSDILLSVHSVHSNQVKSWYRNGIWWKILPLVTQVFKFFTLNKSYHCTILYFDTNLTHEGIHIQNVSVEARVRQIRAVQRVFHSRTDVAIFDLITMPCRTAHNFQPRKFVHKGLNSCTKYIKSRI